MTWNLQPIPIIPFYVFFVNIVLYLCFIILLHLIYSFLHTGSLLVPYAYVSTESIPCRLLSSLTLHAILLTSSVNTLCFSVLNLCCVFSISSLLFYEFFIIFLMSFDIKIIFVINSLFCFQFDLLLNSVYNLQVYVFFLQHTFLSLWLFYLHRCYLLNRYIFLLSTQKIFSLFDHLIQSVPSGNGLSNS